MIYFFVIGLRLLRKACTTFSIIETLQPAYLSLLLRVVSPCNLSDPMMSLLYDVSRDQLYGHLSKAIWKWNVLFFCLCVFYVLLFEKKKKVADSNGQVYGADRRGSVFFNEFEMRCVDRSKTSLLLLELETFQSPRDSISVNVYRIRHVF